MRIIKPLRLRLISASTAVVLLSSLLPFGTAFGADSIGASRTQKIGLHQTTTSDDAAPETLPEYVPVAIVGGGLGGLAVCAAMRHRGVDAHVFEAAPSSLRGSTGTGIMISPNGFAALGSIDPRLPDAMRDVGRNIERQRILVTDPSGAVEKEFSFNMTADAEQCNIGWSRAQEILSVVVPEASVHCSARFERYEMSSDADAPITVFFGDGRSVRTSLLVGADGAGSSVRQFMAHDTPKNAKSTHQKKAVASYASQYNGQLLWNAIIPSGDISPVAHAPGHVEYVICGTDGQVVLTFDAGEDRTSWYLTLMEDHVRATNAGDATAYQTLTRALDGSSFGGFGRAGVKEELQKAFAAWPVALACLDATPEDQIFERRLADRPVLMDWTGDVTRNGGSVVLMGDAAHPMIPSQGQGTMMAWEDAADLASCVAPSIVQVPERKGEGNEGVSKAVQRYVAQRAKRAARIQKMSADMYMGRKSSNFFPKKVLSLLKMKRDMTFLKQGYEPIDQMTKKTGFTQKLKRSLSFGIFKG